MPDRQIPLSFSLLLTIEIGWHDDEVPDGHPSLSLSPRLRHGLDYR